MGVVSSISAAGLAAHSSCQPERRTARLTDCSVIPSSCAAIFWVPWVPWVPCRTERSTSTTFHCAAVRSWTRRPISRNTASALAQALAPGTRLCRPRPPLHALHLPDGGRRPATTASGTWAAAPLARSTAARAATKAGPEPSRGLAGSGRSTSPTPIPTYQRPLRRACRAISTTSSARSTTPWTSSPTERSKRPAVESAPSSLRSPGTRSMSPVLPRWSIVMTYMAPA